MNTEVPRFKVADSVAAQITVDADGYYSRPAPRLAAGVRQLGHLLHPDAVADPGLPAVELDARSVALASGAPSSSRAAKARVDLAG